MDGPFSIDSAWLQRLSTDERSRYTESEWSWLLEGTDAVPGHGHGLSCWLETRDLDDIRYCLAAGANATERGADGVTPLTYAYQALTTEKKHYITCVHPEIVRVLTKSLGRTPTQMEIYRVATDKKTRRFRFHVKKRAEKIITKFIEAARLGDLETVRRMVESDEISVNAVDKSTGEPALSAALATGQCHVCIYLLERGAHMMASATVNGRSVSALIGSVLTGNVELVRQVVHRLKSETRDRDALTEAARIGDIDMIETLLELGFHVSPYALSLPRPMGCLMEYIQGLNQEETDHWLLLCIAYWRRDTALFTNLQRRHTGLHDLASHETFAVAFLVLAVHHQDEELVAELLQKGVSPNRVVGSKANAMVAAVGVDSTRMLRLLMEHGGDATATCGYYSHLSIPSPSLLTMAVLSNAMESVRMLLPLETRPHFRQQALQQAIKQESMEVIELLLTEDGDALAPTTPEQLEMRVSSTRSPVQLDLMLMWWCPSAFPISSLKRNFLWKCGENDDPALLSVYLAHGLDLADFVVGGDVNATSPLVQGVIRGDNHLPAIPVVQLLLESGVPSISVDENGRTPEQDMDEEITGQQWPNDMLKGVKRKLFGRCRDLFAAHSSPVC